jgi:hypothetical protein
MPAMFDLHLVHKFCEPGNVGNEDEATVLHGTKI